MNSRTGFRLDGATPNLRVRTSGRGVELPINIDGVNSFGDTGIGGENSLNAIGLDSRFNFTITDNGTRIDALSEQADDSSKRATAFVEYNGAMNEN